MWRGPFRKPNLRFDRWGTRLDRLIFTDMIFSEPLHDNTMSLCDCLRVVPPIGPNEPLEHAFTHGYCRGTKARCVASKYAWRYEPRNGNLLLKLLMLFSRLFWPAHLYYVGLLDPRGKPRRLSSDYGHRLYGITNLQTYIYYQQYPDDWTVHKVVVSGPRRVFDQNWSVHRSEFSGVHQTCSLRADS
jgi:hypothetical protein